MNHWIYLPNFIQILFNVYFYSPNIKNHIYFNWNRHNSKFNIILINIFNKRDDDKIYTSNYVKIQRQK